MWNDEIVEEVRRVLEEHAAKFNHDLKAILDDARKRQRESGRKSVSFSVQKPESNRIEKPIVEKA